MGHKALAFPAMVGSRKFKQTLTSITRLHWLGCSAVAAQHAVARWPSYYYSSVLLPSLQPHEFSIRFLRETDRSQLSIGFLCETDRLRRKLHHH